ncbi:hypothetical protein MUK42_05240, partial [Musa troglodytarum]
WRRRHIPEEQQPVSKGTAWDWKARATTSPISQTLPSLFLGINERGGGGGKLDGSKAASETWKRFM